MATLSPRFATDDDVAAAPRNSPAGIALVVFAVAALLAYCADRGLSHTALITPISPVGLWLARALGLCAGLAAAVATTTGRGLAFYRQAILMLVIPFGGYALGDGIAWRLADHWHFAGSLAEWSPARFPVVNVKGGGKSRSYSLGIDPFQTGDPAGIAIPFAQYQALRDAFAGQCVTVAIRRAADGATEVRTRPLNPGPGGEAEVAPCNGNTSSASAHASPWR
ncbi:MAG: hypothetical protein KGN34_01540 [Sphingomonadales bacterium]|nr:hypothetical protein [Sphingomonadales bacterium]